MVPRRALWEVRRANPFCSRPQRRRGSACTGRKAVADLCLGGMPAPGRLQYRHDLAFSKATACGECREHFMSTQFDAELSAALLGFNAEAILYCQGISEMIAQEYARNYARMLQNRAKGLEFSLPRIPHGLFEPNRNLIRSTLERMSEKYFPRK